MSSSPIFRLASLLSTYQHSRALTDYLVETTGISKEDADAIVERLAAIKKAHQAIQEAAKEGISKKEWLVEELESLSEPMQQSLRAALKLPVEAPVSLIAERLASEGMSSLGELGAVLHELPSERLPDLADLSEQWLEAPLGAPVDDTFAAIGGALLLPSAQQIFPGVDAGAVAAGVGLGASVIKAGYQVATGVIPIGDAVQWLGDRVVAATATVVKHALQTHAAQAGAAVGAALGALIGSAPAGALAGAILAREAAGFVATAVSEAVTAIGQSFVKVASFVADTGVSLLKSIKSLFS
jgi:hypothetical protein